eukprot:GHVL01006380.1.p1 GENE.GHVL01006380.1~~GHVL01006380.1.p1  ORF type:complete len:265 (+),score=30.51 GHVL01006380.1:51-845(+)
MSKNIIYFISNEFHLCDDKYNVLYHFHSWRVANKTILALSTRLTAQEQAHLAAFEDQGILSPLEQVRLLNLTPWSVVAIRASYGDCQFTLNKDILNFTADIDFLVYPLKNITVDAESEAIASLRVHFSGHTVYNDGVISNLRQSNVVYTIIYPKLDNEYHIVKCYKKDSSTWIYKCKYFEIVVTPSKFFAMETKIHLNNVVEGSCTAACLLMLAFTILYAHPDRLTKEFVIREYQRLHADSDLSTNDNDSVKSPSGYDTNIDDE